MTKLPVPIPSGFEVKVKEGQKVSEKEILAEDTEDNSSQARIKVSAGLSISPEKAKKLLKKNPGDKIEESDLIAEVSNLLQKKAIISKIDGTFLRFDENSGEIIVKTEKAKSQGILSPISGKVSKIEEGKIEIETESEAVSAEKGTGERAEAERVNSETALMNSWMVSAVASPISMLSLIKPILPYPCSGHPEPIL